MSDHASAPKIRQTPVIAQQAAAPFSFARNRSHAASHTRMNDSPAAPHSFSMGFQRALQTKKKPGARQEVARMPGTRAHFNALPCPLFPNNKGAIKPM